MLNLLKDLCAIDGVAGSETKVSDYIVKFAKKHADEVTVDLMGNVLVYKKGARTPKNRVAFCAHMDEVGLVVTYITDDGYLKFGTAGIVDNRIIMGKAVRVGDSSVLGVIGSKPAYLCDESELESPPDVSDMYIDIGAKDKQDALKLVALGDNCAFESDICEFGNGFIKSKAIDDRYGCVTMMELIRSDLAIDCMFAFTVQEEVGARGAITAAFSIAPDIAIIIEGTSAADLPSTSGAKKVCHLGNGPVIPFIDEGTIYNKEIYNLLTNTAEKHNIPWQTKTYIAGVTDASVFQRSRSGVKAAGIAAPIRNLHSQSCVGKIQDMENVIKLLKLALEDIE